MISKSRNTSAGTAIQIKLSNSSYYTAEDEYKESSNKLKKDVPLKKASSAAPEKTSKPSSGGWGNNSAKYYTDGAEEGYHTVSVSKVYSQCYVVIKKLRWGYFSTV